MSNTSQQTAATAYRWRWFALAALLVAEAMNLLDSTIVQVAAPKIHADLGGSVPDIQWFTSAYTLPFALLLITGGRLGDIFGRRRVFVVGVAGFALSSLACALAPSVGVLIGFRVVQGAAAAVIIPQTIGLIKTMFQGPEVSKALGSIGPVMGLAAVLGPVLGGVLTHADLFGSSWRAAFLVNLPLSVGVLLLAPLLVENHAPKRPSLDPLGTLLAMAGIGLVVYPLIEANNSSMSGLDWAGIAVGLLLLVGFGLQQRRSARQGRSPLVEASLFAHRGFPAALGTSVLFFAVTTGLMLVVVLQLQLGLGTDVLTAGLSLVPWSAGLGVASWVAGAYLVSRYGQRVMFAGLVVLLAGLLAAVAVYHFHSPDTYPTPLLGALALVGIGHGLFAPSFFTSALHPVRPQEIGSAAGLLNAVQQLGATLGIAVLVSVYLHGAHAGGHAAAAHAALAAFLVGAGLVVASMLTAALMKEPSAHEQTQPAGAAPVAAEHH